jgi:hypothetical protein
VHQVFDNSARLVCGMDQPRSAGAPRLPDGTSGAVGDIVTTPDENGLAFPADYWVSLVANNALGDAINSSAAWSGATTTASIAWTSKRAPAFAAI